jgi:hypothetical protein
MASDDKKAAANPAPKKDNPPKSTSTPPTSTSAPPTSTSAPPTSTSTPDSTASKAAGGESDANASSGYSRGEGQKPVSKAYKDNWNLIFGKKKKR